MSESTEIMQTVEHLQQTLENCAVRGLRSIGSQERNTLRALAEEFGRVGAHHLSGRIGALCDALERDDRSAAAALLHAQASLRVFERILTLESAQAALNQFAQGAGRESE